MVAAECGDSNTFGPEMGSYLTSIRETAGFGRAEFATALTLRLSQPVAVSDLEAWESSGDYPAWLILAAHEIAGLTAAEVLGWEATAELRRIEKALGHLAQLLNDPIALRRRAADLDGGRARPFIL